MHTILQADAAALPLPDSSVDVVVTSPPYRGQRQYSDAGEPLTGQIGDEATPAEYIKNLLDCTREWCRILKPTGSMFVNIGDKYSGAGRGNHDSPGLNNPAGTRAARLRSSSSRQHLGLDMAPTKSLMGLAWRYAIGCIDELELVLRAEILILRSEIIWEKPNGMPDNAPDRVRRSHERVFHFTREPHYYARRRNTLPRRCILGWSPPG